MGRWETSEAEGEDDPGRYPEETPRGSTNMVNSPA